MFVQFLISENGRYTNLLLLRITQHFILTIGFAIHRKHFTVVQCTYNVLFARTSRLSTYKVSHVPDFGQTRKTCGLANSLRFRLINIMNWETMAYLL